MSYKKKSRFEKIEDEIKDTFSVKKEEPKKEEGPTMQEKVKEHSVCGSCLQSFQDQPKEVKVSGKFEGKEVKGYQCNSCNTAKKDLRVVVAEADNEQGLIEVRVTNLEHKSKLKD